MNFSTKKQVVKPPQRGIFPLDHDSECKSYMEEYLDCMNTSNDTHHKCRDFSRNYLQCRMNHDLMSKENLDHLGFAPNIIVKGATEYDKSKEIGGYVAGKHISKQSNWWFTRPFWKSNSWYSGSDGDGSGSGSGSGGESSSSSG